MIFGGRQRARIRQLEQQLATAAETEVRLTGKIVDLHEVLGRVLAYPRWGTIGEHDVADLRVSETLYQRAQALLQEPLQ